MQLKLSHLPDLPGGPRPDTRNSAGTQARAPAVRSGIEPGGARRRAGDRTRLIAEGRKSAGEKGTALR